MELRIKRFNPFTIKGFYRLNYFWISERRNYFCWLFFFSELFCTRVCMSFFDRMFKNILIFSLYSGQFIICKIDMNCWSVSKYKWYVTKKMFFQYFWIQKWQNTQLEICLRMLFVTMNNSLRQSFVFSVHFFRNWKSKKYIAPKCVFKKWR